jgi:zinc protease
MQLRRTALVLCALAALCAAAPRPGAAAANTVDTLVDQVVAAYGGTAALAKVSAYRMEGTVDSVMRGAGPLVRTFARPDRLKISLEYPGHLETRILNGGKGWRSDAKGKGEMVPADGFLLTSMTLQAARADLPWVLAERKASLKLLAPMDNGKLQGVELPVGEGLILTVYVETATGRVVRSSGVLAAPGMKTNFATDYSDFRAVDGVLFPFHEANFAANQSTGDTVIAKIVLNPPLTDADFNP